MVGGRPFPSLLQLLIKVINVNQVLVTVKELLLVESHELSSKVMLGLLWIIPLRCSEYVTVCQGAVYLPGRARPLKTLKWTHEQIKNLSHSYRQ